LGLKIFILKRNLAHGSNDASEFFGNQEDFWWFLKPQMSNVKFSRDLHSFISIETAFWAFLVQIGPKANFGLFSFIFQKPGPGAQKTPPDFDLLAEIRLFQPKLDFFLGPT
jgi:hypothetical protein